MKRIVILAAAVVVTATAFAATSGSSTADNNQGANRATAITTVNSAVNPGVRAFAQADGFAGNFSANNGDGIDYGAKTTPAYEVNPVLSGSYGFNDGFAVYGSASVDYKGNMGKYAEAGPLHTYNNEYAIGGQYTIDPNYQVGLETSLLNWNNYTKNGGPSFVSNGFKIMPYAQFIDGANALYLEAGYKNIVGAEAVGTTAKGTHGTLWYFNPQYSFVMSPALTYGAQMDYQIASVDYQAVSTAANSGDGDLFSIKPLILTYNVAAVPGLTLIGTTKWEADNFRKSTNSATGASYSDKMVITPEVSYTYAVTPQFSLSADTSLDIGQQLNKTNQANHDAGEQNVSYSGKVTVGASYNF